MYDEEEFSWTEFVYDSSLHLGVVLDDLRIRYLDSTDFNALGYLTKKIWIKKVEVIKDILYNGTEVTEEIDVFEEEKLIVIKGGRPKGFFFPYAVEKNVQIGEIFHTVKNGTELKKILG
jgi:hypothetical protein